MVLLPANMRKITGKGFRWQMFSGSISIPKSVAYGDMQSLFNQSGGLRLLRVWLSSRIG